MKIILGKTAGFCYGVKRAVDGAIKEINEIPKVQCLGEIVHNKQVVNDLKNKGIEFIENIQQANKPTIIRAHGVPKEVYTYAQNNNIEIIDYTCPNVLKIHKIIEEYSKNEYFIILCGSETHPENVGSISHCKSNYFIIEFPEDTKNAVKKIKELNVNKILLIAQTTYSIEKFEQIQKELIQSLDENIKIVVKNTICKATELRQKETEKISKDVEYMIIIGGKNSSNTKKLYDIASKNCKNSICIENKEELNIEEVKKYEKIGVMAGASTPEESIRAVISEIYN
mgnify:FL=1